MRSSEFIQESRQLLYHAFKTPDKAIIALEQNALLGYTMQRYWADGKPRKDNEPDYKGSLWLKGISTTRDINYAKKWGMVVFILNRDKIANHYKIIPYNWGYSLPQNNHHKREREEFVVTGKIPAISTEGGEYPFNDWLEKPVGKIDNLESFLVGIYHIDDSHVREYWMDDMNKIESHEKFIGTY